MSGVEAVGLALNIWPVVVNFLEAYKLAVSGQGWDKVYQEFKTERVIYVDCVQHLLQGSVSEADLSQLCSFEKPNQPLWDEKLKDPNLRNSLQRLLGSNKTPIVLETLRGIDEHLATLCQKIETADAFLHKASHSNFRKLGRHIKINLPQSTIKECLSKVQEHNARLQRLLLSPPGRRSNQPTNLPAHVLRRITAQANQLHDAICEGYNCQCRNPHQASLGTHPPDDLDLSQPFDLLFPVDEAVAKGITGQDLPSPKSKPSSEKSDEESDFSSISSQYWSSSRESIGTSPSLATSPSTPPPRLRGRSISFSQSHGLEDGGLISDLCQFIRKLGENPLVAAPPSCFGVLGVQQKRYSVKVTSLDGDSTDLPSLVSLDEYLSPSHKSEVTRKKRMDLALSLSLAILQFYTTPWIDMWWTWKDFCVLKGDKSQIFVTKKFYSVHREQNINKTHVNHSESTSTFWKLYGEPVLTRLGFALVELALGQRLSELRDKDQLSDGNKDMVDLMTAQRLVEENKVFQEAGHCYNEAVKACLTHQVFSGTGMTSLNSSDPRNRAHFQVDVERFVVAPIRDHFKRTWELIPREMDVEAY